MIRLGQVIGADFISVAGHSLRLHHTPLEGQCFRGARSHGKQWYPQIPRPRNSSVPSCRSSHSSGLCPKTLLVSARLGRGAATGPLVTNHQDDERERQSNQYIRLRAVRPATPAQSVLYRRKESAEGLARYEPVRPGARALPSAVTRSQSVGGQTRVPAKACSTRHVRACARVP